MTTVGRPYFIAAMKRTGQHAVINWLAQQISHDVLHFNNCVHGWDKKKLSPMKDSMTVFYKWAPTTNTHIVKNYFHDWKIDLALSKQLEFELANDCNGGTFKNVRSVIYNIEDFDLDTYDEKKFHEFEQLRTVTKILVVRSAQNFISSCLQRKINPPDPGAADVGDDLVRRMVLWKQHAKKALSSKSGYYVILFDLWFSDQEYRRLICKDLGLLFTDNGLNSVTNFGSGSSFDRQKFDNNAQKMSVLNRWMQYHDQQELFSYLDQEAFELNKQLFNFK